MVRIAQIPPAAEAAGTSVPCLPLWDHFKFGSGRGQGVSSHACHVRGRRAECSIDLSNWAASWANVYEEWVLQPCHPKLGL